MRSHARLFLAVRERNPIPAVAVVGAFVVSLLAIPFLEKPELRAYDARIGLRRDAGWPEDLVLMAISWELMPDAHERFPPPAENLALLLEKLSAAGVRTIALDAELKPFEHPETDFRLKAGLRGVVLAATFFPRSGDPALDHESHLDDGLVAVKGPWPKHAQGQFSR